MIKLKVKLVHLPSDPGVYVMKDCDGKVIYVGKAKRLKPRVASYFRRSALKDPRIHNLVEEIEDFEIFVVTSEREALLLERTLIRAHRPFYNVRHKNHKEYPLIRVSTHEPWPTFRLVHKLRSDGATYIGPFGNGYQQRLLLELIHRMFPLVRCSRWDFSHATRPCAYYDMKQCLAPCSKKVDPVAYRQLADQAITILQGAHAETKKHLLDTMKTAALAQDFERAATLRDQLKAMAVIKSNRTQVVYNNNVADCDIIGLAADQSTLCLSLLKIREKKLAATFRYALSLPQGDTNEGLCDFLQRYVCEHLAPAEIVVGQIPIQQTPLTSPFISSRKMVIPQRGKKKKLLEIANRNASLHLAELRRSPGSKP